MGKVLKFQLPQPEVSDKLKLDLLILKLKRFNKQMKEEREDGHK